MTDRPRESNPGQSARRTMPPPELFERSAPASVGSLVLENMRAEAPMPRHAGPRAEEAHLLAELRGAREEGDLAAERAGSIALSRLLAARGRDLGVATGLARRALALGDDPDLLAELAGWLAGLGDNAAAAAALRALMHHDDAGEAARTLVKIAVLLARAGDAGGAAEALDEAAGLSPADAMAVELFGTLSAWAPEVVTPEGAAAAYLEAARRRREAGDEEASFEDLLRAFDLAPRDAASADAVAEALVERGLPGAADEVVRLSALAHAAAQAPEEAAALHRRRLLASVRDGDGARAAAAVLDARLEGEIDGPDAAKVDEALGLAGLHELTAIRLQMRAEARRGVAAAEAWEALARLSAGPLASPDRALDAWIEALAADPSSKAARVALRDHLAAHHDPWPLVEALVRVGMRPPAEDDGPRLAALRDLFGLAADKLSAPALATFALAALDAAGEGEGLHVDRAALLARTAQEDEEIAAARAALEAAGAGAEARADALHRLAAAYLTRPAQAAEQVRILAEMLRAQPADRAILTALERAARRAGSDQALEAVLRERLDGARRTDAARMRLSLAAIARRRGDEAAALAEIGPAGAEAGGNRAAACAVLVLAARLGREKERAEALAQLAAPAWPGLRAALLSVAAELAPPEVGRRLAEQACEADPQSARAVSTLASLAGQGRSGPDRLGTAAVERAMTTVLPRSVWCDRLARSFAELAEPALSLAWTQRWLALRPGSAEAMSLFLLRASAARDAAPVGDALGWVLAQPRPLGDFVEPITAGLFELLELDRGRARALARRALDVIGPRAPVLRARLLELSERAVDPGLAIAVLERYLAAEELGAYAGEILLELSRRRTNAGDYDGAAREIARAAAEGAAPDPVLEHAADLEAAMREAGAWLGSDGLCALAEARALALAAMGEVGRLAAASAYRELGSLRWDLAEDHRGAEEAFFRACELSPRNGVERYARDLCAFAGVLDAIETLATRASRCGDDQRRTRAALLLEAAQLASEHGMPERALTAAAGAIEADPSRADVVALVEKNAHVEGGLALLDRTYERLAGAALGCFGRRAAHYRAARQLDRRGAVDPALRHAALCFEAVPSEGTSYVLLTRLAERAGDPGEAVRALVRVAGLADPGMRPVWLKRAASVADRGEDGPRTRFDLLLRALNARAEPGTVLEVATAARRLLGAGDPEAAEMVRLRFERAVKASLPKLDGPDGARAAVEMARLAVELGDVALAFAALDRAAAADGDVDEYALLAPLVPRLVADESAAPWVSALRATAERPYSSVGPALLRLAAQVAAALGEATARAGLLVQAAKRAPDDDDVLEEAQLAVNDAGDVGLAAKLDTVSPPAERALAWTRLAEQREREGREPDAIAAFSRAVDSGLLPRDVRDRAALRLQSLLDRTGRDQDAEALLRGKLARGSLLPPARTRAARDLSELLLRRDDTQGAFTLLADLAEAGPTDPELLAELRGLARATDDLTRYAKVLAVAAARAEPGAQRLSLLRELGPLFAELGEREQAAACYEEIARLDPADEQAIEVLERAAADRGDPAAAAELLARRVALTPAGDKRRMLRIRRAALLEQRLGRFDDAAEELSALLSEAPADAIALRFLADIHERRDAPLEAAALLERLFGLADTAEERAEYGLRCASAYVAAGELDHADAVLESVAQIAAPEEVLERRVELWRRRGDAQALTEGLDQLAASSREPVERRAAMLVEAARHASALGDEAGAQDRVRRALKLAPELPDAVLEARRLTYRAGGTGTPREAAAAVEELSRVEGKLDASQIELCAFLLAEELDVIQGGGAGMRELSRRHAEVGPLPLIALGMAERMVRLRTFDGALPLFERALAGDLRGLRSRGRVALAAAEAATNAQAYTAAAQLLEVAEAEPETQALAQRRQLELAAALGEPDIAKQALEELLRQSNGIDRARVLLSLGKLISAEDPDRAADLLAEAGPLSASDRALSTQLAQVSARLDAQRAQPEPVPSAAVGPAPSSHPGPTATSRPAVPPPPPASPLPEPPRPPSLPPPPPPVPELRSRLRPLPPLSDPPPPTLSDPPPALAGTLAPLPGSSAPVQEGEEMRLLGAFAHGSWEAGEQLVAIHAGRPGERSRQEIFAIRRQQAQLRPGDAGTLRALGEAALADGNTGYARALEHALRALEHEGPAAPPLGAQRLAPEQVSALLFRGTGESKVHEALALVAETTMYRREVAQYHLTGVARVQPGGGSALGEAFGAVVRLFGQARTGLFHLRGAGAPSYKIALLSPPAVVLSGEVREETPELRYLLGAALAAALPENALVSALSPAALRNLIDALHAAFGPVADLPRGDAEVARLAQKLWQMVPARADRRLRELFVEPAELTYDAAVAGTRAALRHAGLFASGSLGVAIAHVAAELSTSLDELRAAPDGLARMCQDHPEIADLVRLATRMEFAEARWASASSAGPRSQRW